MLATDAYAAEVQADIDEARAIGVNGVPFFVLDRRYGISGAQPAELFLEALRTARRDAEAEATRPRERGRRRLPDGAAQESPASSPSSGSAAGASSSPTSGSASASTSTNCDSRYPV